MPDFNTMGMVVNRSKFRQLRFKRTMQGWASSDWKKHTQSHTQAKAVKTEHSFVAAASVLT